MPESLLTEEWRHLLHDYQTLFVGFSGGLDSTVLLHCLAHEPTLVNKLKAVHVHHGLSRNATMWQEHCERFCDNLGLSLIVRQVDVPCQANIEEGARIARYEAFSSLLKDNDCLLLAHHCDDQAETLLLQLFRGAGINGLAAMTAVKSFAKGELARPFLQHSRQTLEAYANHHRLIWVDDESNQNSAFSRNFLRHQIMPLLQEKWPAVVNNLVRTASHCQHAKVNLEALASIDCQELNEHSDMLSVASLLTLDYPRLVNVLRVWLHHNHIRMPSVTILNRMITEVIFARSDAMPEVQWGEWIVRRYQQRLYVMNKEALNIEAPASIEWPNFPAPLSLDPSGASGQFLCATPNAEGLRVTPEHRLSVRFRQGGEMFSWRGQTKQLKKLLQQWQVPPWQRDRIPLLYIDNDLAAVVGYAVSDRYFSVGEGGIYQLAVRI